MVHAKFHNQPFIRCRAIWRHVRGHTDTHTHTHTIKPPTAGVQLVGHTSINTCHSTPPKYLRLVREAFQWRSSVVLRCCTSSCANASRSRFTLYISCFDYQNKTFVSTSDPKTAIHSLRMLHKFLKFNLCIFPRIN